MAAPKDDEEKILAKILAGETVLYEIIIRKYNQRLYRIGLSILQDPQEVEDAMQETYIRAFQQLSAFEGRSSFGTWLTKILINEALGMKRKRRNEDTLDEDVADAAPSPFEQVARNEMCTMIEDAIQRLPDSYRSVFVMREVECMSSRETAACLSLSEENVKVRLHRAKKLLKDDLSHVAGGLQVFQFQGIRCDNLVAATLRRIGPVGRVQSIGQAETTTI